MPSTADIFASDRSAQIAAQKPKAAEKNRPDDDDKFARTLDDVREPAEPRKAEADRAKPAEAAPDQTAKNETSEPDATNGDDRSEKTAVKDETGAEATPAETAATETPGEKDLSAAPAHQLLPAPAELKGKTGDQPLQAAAATAAAAQTAGERTAQAAAAATPQPQPRAQAASANGPVSQLPEIPEILPRGTGANGGRIDLASLTGASRGLATALSGGQTSDIASGFKAVAAQGPATGTAQAALQTAATAQQQAASPAAAQNAAQPIQVQLPVDQQQAQKSVLPDTPATTQTVSVQTTGGVQNAAGTQAPSFAQQMAQTQAQPPAQQLGIHIARGAREGVDRIEIQLHPQELGRVEVKMELGHDGRVMAVISADKAETLEQLRRDVHQLEKALADSGFNMDRESFRFAGGRDGNDAGGPGSSIFADDDDLPPAPLAQRSMRLDSLGVDISV
ncbi:MAG: flagellar hook-length control protein FliK [Minwuia sp.]|uniref:flagellar hook-length control protein FliK n=1 Tax=Minwuia sp. TaxID=2493630 RepID=UPI003A88764D